MGHGKLVSTEVESDITERCPRDEPPLYKTDKTLVACHYDIDFKTGEAKAERWMDLKTGKITISEVTSKSWIKR